MTPSKPHDPRQDPVAELHELRARLAKLEHIEADCKETLRLLQQVEQRQAFLLNSVPIALYSARPADFLRTWISGDIERVTGFFPDRFTDEPSFWQMRVHPEDTERVAAALAALPQEGRVTVEYRWRCTDGSYRWFLDQAVLVRDLRNEPKEIVGSWLDITDRKRANEELERSEARFRLMARATNDAVWDWDLTNNQVWWNEGIRALFGYQPHELQPTLTWWSERIHEGDRERVLAGIHAVIDNGWQFWSDEYRFRKADGAYAIVYDRGYVIRDAGGRGLRMIGAMIDLTDRLQAEQSLRDSEARFRAFMDQTTAAAFIKDDAGRLVYMNAPCLTWFKFGPDWRGKTSRELFPPEVAAKLEAHDRDVLAAGAPKQFRESVPSAQGMREWVTIRFPFHDSAGRRFIGGIAFDVTEVAPGPRADELLAKVKELEGINRLMLDRESRILQLKAEVKRLQDELNANPPS